MHFGAALRLLRFESGLSLRDLARRLGVSSTYLSRVENGIDAAPTPSRLEAMAKELGVPPPVLMGLAHRVSPLVVDYVEQTPEAGALFLEIAHRRLGANQLSELRAFLNERFPVVGRAAAAASVTVSSLLAPERVVLGFSCSGMEDVLDVAAGRLAGRASPQATAIATALKQREAEIVSSIGGGVAVPCASLPAAAPAAVLVTLAPPLAYETPDEGALRLVIALLGPPATVERRVALAQIARLTALGLADKLAGIRSPVQAMARLSLLEM